MPTSISLETRDVTDVTHDIVFSCFFMFFPLAKGRSTLIPVLWNGYRSSHRHSPFQCSCNPSIWHKVHRLLLRNWGKRRKKHPQIVNEQKRNLSNLSTYRNFSMGWNCWIRWQSHSNLHIDCHHGLRWFIGRDLDDELDVGDLTMTNLVDSLHGQFWSITFQIGAWTRGYIRLGVFYSGHIFSRNHRNRCPYRSPMRLTTTTH